LQSEIQRFSQGSEPLAQGKDLFQPGSLGAGVQSLSLSPAQNRGIIRQQVGWCQGTAARRVDEIQPDRVTQKGELRLGYDS